MPTPDPGSAEHAAVDDHELPPVARSLWRSLKLGYRAEPMLLVVSCALTIAAALPDALFAVGLRALVQASEDGGGTSTLVAALCLGGLAAGGWILKVGSERLNRRFADRSTVVIESHVANLQASIPTVAHQENPVLLDRLAMLRDQVFTLNHLYGSLFTSAGTILRLALTLVLLATVHPVLVLLGVAALPAVWLSGRRSVAERAAMERGAQHERLARHLFLLGSSPAPAKELRVTRTEAYVRAERRTAWERGRLPVERARWVTAAAMSVGWVLFGAAFSAAIVFVSSRDGADAGDVLLVLIAGSRLSQYIGLSITEVGFLRGFWLDAARRLAWLEDYAARTRRDADQPVPERISSGIDMTGVSFVYPGTTRRVLDDVTVHLPAGSVVAVVGENGAGKSTFVKLLCRFYDPTEGSITVDGADLLRMPADGWRRRTTGSFQDFFRFELPARQSIGLGDLRHVDDEPAVLAAVGRGGAEDVVQRLPSGLATQLGPTWDEGVELSHGQWQKVALARGFMPEDALVLVLDEPTSALDAETEHALFERYAAAARDDGSSANGRITVLVSHRFSTVRMADLIVVMDGNRVVETGTHAELLAKGGQYAELYTIQASAYR